MSTKKIYKLINTKDNKIYIGKTIKDLAIRLDEHIRTAKRWAAEDLQSKKHPYKSRLYPAINKWGYEAFKIELIEELLDGTETSLEDREKYWISFFNSTDDSIGYNISPGGLGGPLFKGHHHTKDMKQAARLRRKGIPQEGDFVKYRTRNTPKFSCQCLETGEFFKKLKDTGFKLSRYRTFNGYEVASYQRQHFIKTLEKLSYSDCAALLTSIRASRLFVCDDFSYESGVKAMHKRMKELLVIEEYRQKIRASAKVAAQKKQENYWTNFILDNHIDIESYKQDFIKYQTTCPNKHLELLYHISYAQVRGLNKYLGLSGKKSGHKYGKVSI